MRLWGGVDVPSGKEGGKRGKEDISPPEQSSSLFGSVWRRSIGVMSPVKVADSGSDDTTIPLETEESDQNVGFLTETLNAGLLTDPRTTQRRKGKRRDPSSSPAHVSSEKKSEEGW